MLPCSIPLLHSFDKANPRPLACLSSRRRCTWHPLLSVPFHPPSRAQKRLLKAQSRCFKSLSVHSPTTSPFQLQHPTSLHSRSNPFSLKRRCSSLPPSFCQLENTRNECWRMPSSRAAPPIRHEGFMSSLTPHSPYSQPCQDVQRLAKELLSPITINDTSNTSSSIDNTPSISSPPPSSNLTPFLATPTSSSSLFWVWLRLPLHRQATGIKQHRQAMTPKDGGVMSSRTE